MVKALLRTSRQSKWQFQQLKELTDGYKLSDIFNMDECGLFYAMAPDRTIAARQLEGTKKDKIRITVALTCNADGSEKLAPFFLGTAAKPRAFEHKSAEQFGFYYRNNNKGWMTGVMFQVSTCAKCFHGVTDHHPLLTGKFRNG